MDKIVIFGSGQMAELAWYYFTHDSPFQVVAFTVHQEYMSANTMMSLPVVPYEQLKGRYSPDEYHLFIAVGYSKMNALRTSLVEQARQSGYRLPGYISSKATIFPDLSHNQNCFILEDNTIQPFVKIGHNVVLWSGNHIGHHSVIEDNCFITSHVVISGGCRLGRNSFIGVNATVQDQITLAPHTLVGASTLINKDTQAHGIYTGVPGRQRAGKSSDIDI